MWAPVAKSRWSLGFDAGSLNVKLLHFDAPYVNLPYVNMFRSRLRTAPFGASLRALTLAGPRRGIHQVPALPEGDYFARNGVPDFMSQAGFKLAWSDYMGLVTEKLNELTAGEAAYPSIQACAAVNRDHRK